MPAALPLKMRWPENENTENLKIASFIVIMLLHEVLTQVHSQKKLRLHFGSSFALMENGENLGL